MAGGSNPGILEAVVLNTRTYLEAMPKAVRKKKGQFFTSQETARYMASLFDLSNLRGSVQILDPGAGSGILSAALIERLNNESNQEGLNRVVVKW